MTASSEAPRIGAPFAISRRRMLATSLAFAAGGGLSGCGGNLNVGSLLDPTMVKSAQNIASAESLGEKDEIEIGNALYGRIVDSQGAFYRNTAVQASIERFA